MNSRRTTDVNAVDFCILEIFSKSDYESLKVEFPGILSRIIFADIFLDIMPRLKAGLQHYKNTHLSRIVSVVKKIEFFHDFTDAELDEIIMNYFDEIFIDPQKIILKPKYVNFLITYSTHCLIYKVGERVLCDHAGCGEGFCRYGRIQSLYTSAY